MRVAVVSEYYPRPGDPVNGVWAHRQALAARDAGADVRVFVLDRPIPPLSALRDPRRLPSALASTARRPRNATLDGIEVEYVRFLAPPRGRSYAHWHRYARAPLARALDAAGPLDLVHAHYAHLAGPAARAWTEPRGVPLCVSVHGGDVLMPALQAPPARATVAATLQTAAGVLCNSAATLARAASLAGTEEHMRVVHLGAEPPTPPLPPKHERPTVATLAHVIPRKRHAAVLEALPDGVDWVVIGDGPELPRLRATAGDRARFLGELPPEDALRELSRCHAMALPSVDEAFGVAYVEALACGVPAVGLMGEGGPEEIAALGGGMLLVPPGDTPALREAIQRAIGDPRLPDEARSNAAQNFSWDACGRATVAAYEAAL